MVSQHRTQNRPAAILAALLALDAEEETVRRRLEAEFNQTSDPARWLQVESRLRRLEPEYDRRRREIKHRLLFGRAAHS